MLKNDKKKDMINTYQNNQWNSRLETKYCYIVQKLKNSGMESLTQNKSRREENKSSFRTKRSLPYPPPERQCEKKNCLRAEGGKEGGKEREKGYKRRYLVPKLEEIKKALARGTKLPKTGE
ncbi:hypothetical protein G9A89_017224 [Geosiphon pyriformis]|nr:hypothetical protein G9A89_017224 [Geosiphon pyriformis]